MPWLRNEDAALKAKLQNLTVIDGTAPGGRPVPVRYLLPEDEIANLTYPCIIIKHLPVVYGSDRAHSGYVQLPYAPEGLSPWWDDSPSVQLFGYGQDAYSSGGYGLGTETTTGVTFDPTQSPYFSYFPTPVYMDYQVTLLARFMTQHVQPLLATLITEHYLPFQYGYLNVPQDGTHRTMLVEAGPSPGYGKDEDNKRIFTVDWRVRVFSEVVPTVTTTAQYGGTLVPVNTIDIDLSVYADTLPIDLETPAGIQKNIGIYSYGQPSQFNVQQEP